VRERDRERSKYI